ncbi:hypothetical protein UY3_17535 [Chelonia mydas]|uniref:Uncharacterized protein n=1 Tax=Chelonia mydas TaxID=8469 RepID=M7BAZ7_CHEMY|nr:hypothetical protein UY3_17535 [Chelonia mydas]
MRKANHCSGDAPMSCQFYKELDVILGGNPTSTVKYPVDTSLAHVPVESGPSQEEAILEKEGEREPEADDNLEVRDACIQELFSTLEEPSQSQQSDLGERKQERRPLTVCDLAQRRAESLKTPPQARKKVQAHTLVPEALLRSKGEAARSGEQAQRRYYGACSNNNGDIAFT